MGNYSNKLTPGQQLASKEALLNAIKALKEQDMKLLPQERFIVPEDWEYSLPEAVVDEIRRRTGKW